MKSHKIALSLLSLATAATLIACGNKDVVKEDVTLEEFIAAIGKIEDTPNNHVEFTSQDSVDSSLKAEQKASLTYIDEIWEFDANSETQDPNAMTYAGMNLKELVNFYEKEQEKEREKESSESESELSSDEAEPTKVSSQRFDILGEKGFRVEIKEETVLTPTVTTGESHTSEITTDKYGRITSFFEYTETRSYVGEEDQPYKVESSKETRYQLVWSKVNIPGGNFQEVTAAVFKDKAEKTTEAPYTYALAGSEIVSLFGKESYADVLYVKDESGKWATEEKTSSNITEFINKTAIGLYEEINNPVPTSSESSQTTATSLVANYFVGGEEMKVVVKTEANDPNENVSSKTVTSFVFDQYGYLTSFRLGAQISGITLGTERGSIAWHEGELPATSEDSSDSI